MFDPMLVETSRARYEAWIGDADTRRLLKSARANSPARQVRVLTRAASMLVSHSRALRAKFAPAEP